MKNFLKKYKPNKKELFIGSSFALVVILATILTNKYFFKEESSEPIPEVQAVETLERGPEFINVALLGYGGAGHDGGYLSDTIWVARINTNKKTANFVSVPRDLWVEINSTDGKVATKINAAFLQDKGDDKATITKKILETVTAMPVDYFVAVDFNQFQKIIDELGGVTVNVPVTFDDYFYPVRGLELETCGMSPEKVHQLSNSLSGFELEKQFKCRYEHLHFDEGPMKMRGEDALKFVRSRHGTHGGDFARSERQFAVFAGLKDRLISLDAVKNAREIYELIDHMFLTDIDVDTAVKLAGFVANPEEYELNKINLTDENVLTNSRSSAGAFILVPKAGNNNFTEVQKYIEENLR